MDNDEYVKSKRQCWQSSYEVPALTQLAKDAYIKTIESIRAKSLLAKLTPDEIATPEIRNKIITESIIAMGQGFSNSALDILCPRYTPSRNVVINDARFFSFDKQTNLVVIRIQHTDTPSFYVDLCFYIDQLERWLGLHD